MAHIIEFDAYSSWNDAFITGQIKITRRSNTEIDDDDDDVDNNSSSMIRYSFESLVCLYHNAIKINILLLD